MSEYNLSRFVKAQDGVFDMALAEVQRGRKIGHWMWLIFPQMRGLDSSPSSQFYGIGSLGEAHAFLTHPVSAPVCGQSRTFFRNGVERRRTRCLVQSML